MNRLSIELNRLYALPPVATDGPVRACVLQLSAPADWQAVSVVWRGVQTDLDLPAPGIAVTGTDGFALWFSLAQPLRESEAMRFLQALQGRYLQGIAPHRVALSTALDAAAAPPALHAGTGMWSAFIAPDLAPVMNDEPWLDVPPSPEGQAQLLSRLTCIQPADLQRALDRLLPAGVPEVMPLVMPNVVPANMPAGMAKSQTAATLIDEVDPRAFLLRVMNDRSVALALRIEAAKALLPVCAPVVSPDGSPVSPPAAPPAVSPAASPDTRPAA